MAKTSMDRLEAAMDLLTFMVKKDVASGYSGVLDVNEVNEILVTAGYPVIIPESVRKKDLEVDK